MRKIYRCAAVVLSVVWLLSGCSKAPTVEPIEDERAVVSTSFGTTVTSPSTSPTTAVLVPPVEEQPTQEAPLAVNLLEDAAVITTLNNIAAYYDAVGLQVAVVKDGRVVGSHAYGWATKEQTPMTVDHKIRIASVSKVVVGMAVMLAAEDGALDIHEDLSTYWDMTVRNPYYPDTPITMKHLLTHTSSITPLYGWDYSSRYDAVRERFSYHYRATRPGSMSGFIYNNYGFHIAGMTVELATGRHLDAYLHDTLFSPLGIDAAFHSGDIQATDKLVTRYEADGSVVHTVDDQLQVHADDKVGGNGTHFSGGLTISAPDLAKLCAVLANDGEYDGVRLMSAQSVETMETCEDTPWGDEIYQALPLNYHTNICGREALYYHSGHAHGVRSMFSYDPVERDGVVIIMTGADTTNNSYDFSELAYDMSAYLYGIL